MSYTGSVAVHPADGDHHHPQAQPVVVIDPPSPTGQADVSRAAREVVAAPPAPGSFVVYGGANEDVPSLFTPGPGSSML